MDRRRFLTAALTAGAAAVVALSGACRPPPPPRGAALIAPLAGDPDSERLGALYLEAVPDEASADALLDALWGGWTEAQRGAAPDSVWETLRQQHRADMAAGRTLFLGGWLLSLSEARVHALAALL